MFNFKTVTSPCMQKIVCVLLVCSMISFQSQGQAKTRRLPSIINHPSLDLSAPFLSADGNALLFVSNSGQDGALTVSYTSRETDWSEPVEVPKTINTRLNFLRGYALSADGKKLYYTSAKSPTVGGYDIYTSDLKGTTWTDPQNLTMPINSKANEGCPSVTPDGNTLYFMRCDKMDQNKAGGCSLFRAVKKPNGQWDEPQALPASINTGNSQTPRIMADGETLIFSSDKIGTSRGGMDLYVTKFRNNAWTNPQPLDFVNSDKDDQYVSVAALGRYLLKEAPGARKNMELTEFLIPGDLRPKGMMKVEGKVSDATGAVVPSYVAVTDLSTNKKVYSGRPAADGSFFVYLTEGTRYELAVDPEQPNITFFSKQLDLTSDKIPQKEKVNVTLKQPAAGDEIVLEKVRFKPSAAALETSSEAELKQLARLAKANPGVGFEIQVLMSGYAEDSVKSADLTESVVDSVRMQYKAGAMVRDTVIAKVRYHNDRTIQQAQAVIQYLAAQGIDRKALTYFVNAIPAATPDGKKVTVKAVVKKR